MQKYGFGRERRLRKRADFQRVQKVGQAVRSAHFIFLVAVGVDVASRSRLGLVATKRIGNAVARNRIKRLCRDCFRRRPELLPQGIDLVVIVRAGIAGLVQAEVDAEWDTAAPRLRAVSDKVLRG